jgi:hypothetical protein
MESSRDAGERKRERVTYAREERMMQRGKGYDFRTILILAALVLILSTAGSFLVRESSPAFGGSFAPLAQQQQTGHYQIAGRDANSAWVIDTVAGDIFLVYADGKWKEVGSIFDEKKRIRK